MIPQKFQYIFIVLFLFLSKISTGQTTKLESLTAEDGLSQGMINNIVKDQDGFMWFATNNGLNRYDGYNFKVFTHNLTDSTSIYSNTIYELLIDGKGKLWATNKSIYDKNKEVFYKGLNDGFVQTDLKGNLWASMWSKEAKGSIINTIKELPPNEQGIPQFELEEKFTLKNTWVRRLFFLRDGSLLVVVKSDPNIILKWNEKNNQLDTIASIPVRTINDILETPDGAIWVTSMNHIFKIKNGTLKSINLKLNRKFFNPGQAKINYCPATDKIWFHQYFHPTIYEIDYLQESDEFILDEAAIVHLDPKTYPTKIYFEEDRIAWIGTGGYGVRKLNLKKYPFRLLTPNLSTRNLSATNDGILLCRRYVGKIMAYKKGETWLLENNRKEQALLKAKDGTIWTMSVGYENKNKDVYQLHQLDDNLQVEKTYSFGDLAIPSGLGVFIEGKDGLFWFVSYKGLLVNFNRKTETFSFVKNKEFKNEGNHWLYQDNVGAIWEAIPNGLYKTTFDQKGGFTTQRYENDPANNQMVNRTVIKCLLDDPTNPTTYLWIGMGDGLNKFNKKTGKVEAYFSTKDGLPDNTVYGILADDEGNLWMSTNKGLSKFNPTTKTFINFVKADGLQDDEFNTTSFYKDEKTGELYFGGINGVTAFHPKDIKLSTFEPIVHITQLKIHGEIVKLGEPLEQRGENPLTQPIEFTKTLRLPWYQNQITLDFASMDFTNPKKNKYQYQLSSVNKDWIDAGTDHKVNYANLTTGTYTFRVRGTNSDGVWSNKETVLKIVIYPPWYRTNLAYAIYAILLIFGIYKLYQAQVRRAKLRNELEFEQKEAARLAEMDKIKTNFFSNITHEFRTPLTLIIEPLRQALERQDLPWQPKVELAQRNSKRLLHLVNQLLDLSKLESKKMNLELKRGDFLKFINPIITSFTALAKRKDIELIYNTPSTLPFFDFDKNKVAKVIYNLISNAIKFTKTNGTIVVNVINNSDTQQLQIQVIDTGIGIPKKEQAYIFDRFYQVDGSNTREHEGTGIGLALSKELAEVMNGQLTFKSELGKGSSFELLIPIVQQSTILEATTTPIETYIPQFGLQKSDVGNQKSDIVINPDAMNVVLIIEDNDDLRGFIKSSIEHEYQVIEANNGQVGLDLALEHIPDIIISDVMMPVMDGFEVCKKVKTDEKTAHIPIILLTAKTAMDSLIKGLKYGADAYMSKPFNTEELRVRIKNLIENRQRLQAKFSQSIEAINPLVKSSIASNEEKQSIPSSLTDDELSPFDQSFLNKVNQIIHAHLDDENFSVEILAKKILLSRGQLHRKIRALLNQSPSELIRNIRLKQGMLLLQQRKGNVTEVAYSVGFSNPKYFSTKFKEKYGKTPSQV